MLTLVFNLFLERNFDFFLFRVVADKFDPSKIISGPLGVSVSGISGTPVILQTSISNLR
jgi:hypothetical protein